MVTSAMSSTLASIEPGPRPVNSELATESIAKRAVRSDPPSAASCTVTRSFFANRTRHASANAGIGSKSSALHPNFTSIAAAQSPSNPPASTTTSSVVTGSTFRRSFPPAR
jgi:hypothetical protein